MNDVSRDDFGRACYLQKCSIVSFSRETSSYSNIYRYLQFFFVDHIFHKFMPLHLAFVSAAISFNLFTPTSLRVLFVPRSTTLLRASTKGNDSAMGKQGTITSFFRPSSAASTSESSRGPKKSFSSTQKRPRPASVTSKASESRSSALKPNGDNPSKKSKTQSHEKPSSSSVANFADSQRDADSEGVAASPEQLNASSEGSVSTRDERRDKDKVKRSEDGESDDDDDDDENPRRKRSVKNSTRKMLEEDNDDDNDDEGHVRKDEDEEDNDNPQHISTKAIKDVARLSTTRTWKDGEPVPYRFLADVFRKVEEISGRLEIQAILTELFRNVIVSTPEDLVPTIYLCCNKLAPAHDGIELGIGESILLKALSQVSGRTVDALKSLYKEKGDLGDVAATARTNQKTMFPPPPLTIRKVFQEFKAIAIITGKNTQEQKRCKILKLLVAASTNESKYISRAVLGKLRIHLADKTVIAALAAAVVFQQLNVRTNVLLTKYGKRKAKMTRKEEDIGETLKDATNTLAAVYSQLPVWDVVVPKLLELKTIDQRLIEACKLIPGIPVSPMLAKPTRAISEVLEKFAETSFTCEYKYDGERAQVHRLNDGTMRIYSRNAENLTPKYPDLVAKIPSALKKDYRKASFIIDAEAVAYDVEKRKILPFQELQGRKRKDVDAATITVKVCIFAFDLLFFNGESLLAESLTERRKRLQEGFCEMEGEFMFAQGHDSREPEMIMDLLNESIKAGCEGLMVKALTGENSTYEPANRSQNWLKVKKDYLEGIGDSLDLVPIGGYLGRGKRTGIYGAFLLACYDPDAEEYQSICKIGTGFSEEDLEKLAKLFNDPDAANRSSCVKSYYKIPELKTLQPDMWFEPVQVWEVKCADLSLSPQHMAAIGQVDPDKGIALRFPRFIRIREDKKPEEATTAEQVVEFYMRQSSVASTA